MAGERDVLAEALAQHVLQSGWVRGPNAAATEARGILDLIAARGWRLAPSPEPLPVREALDVERLQHAIDIVDAKLDMGVDLLGDVYAVYVVAEYAALSPDRPT